MTVALQPPGAPLPGPDTTVARMVSVFRHGSTQPALVETETGARWVLKFSGAGPGPRGLLIEFLAGRLAVLLGLAVPEARPLYLPPGFPWQVGADDYDEMVQRSFGWNLGLAYLDGARDVTLGELRSLAVGFVTRLAAVDRLLQNVDRTPRNANLMRDSAGTVWAIDHDACLFLDRVIGNRLDPSPRLPPGHFLAATTAAAAGRQALLEVPAAAITALATGIPGSWLETQPLTAAELGVRLVEYVARFR